MLLNRQEAPVIEEPCLALCSLSLGTYGVKVIFSACTARRNILPSVLSSLFMLSLPAPSDWRSAVSYPIQHEGDEMLAYDTGLGLLNGIKGWQNARLVAGQRKQTVARYCC
jgi:hypothetical protein